LGRVGTSTVPGTVAERFTGSVADIYEREIGIWAIRRS
jgi:hypothetical protein